MSSRGPTEPIDLAAGPSGEPFDDSVRFIPPRFGGPLLSKLVSVVTWVTGIDRAIAEHAAVAKGVDPGSLELLERVLANSGVRVEVDPAELARIPATGPLVIVANHPFGILDATSLAWAIEQVRTDEKFFANEALRGIPAAARRCFFVDPFGSSAATRRNLPAMRQAVDWIRAGHAVAVFPAGEISRLARGERVVEDGPWDEQAMRLARQSDATIVPVRFLGRNSNLFQLAGLVHPLLRTSLLVREYLNPRERVIRIEVGSPIPPSRWKRWGEPSRALRRVRMGVESLRAAPSTAPPLDPASLRPLRTISGGALLEREVDLLPADQVLFRTGDFRVCIAHASEIPSLLGEIGRLREITFREIGEGTGHSIDLDRYDQNYLQLFVWNGARSELVGAYRLGPTDEILKREGPSGLYTHTLFKFDEEFFARMGPALELGRSFVRSEYQRQHVPLLLLWRGIGRYAARHPRYRCLFGPVSIASDFRPLATSYMVHFALSRPNRPDLKGLMRGRVLPSLPPLGSVEREFLADPTTTPDDLDELVRTMERDRRGVPVLLTQYMKLGGTGLAANVDRSFQNCVDICNLVDLARVDQRVLTHYMGEQTASFYEHHGVAVDRAAIERGGRGSRGAGERSRERNA